MPTVVAAAALLLKKGGLFQAAIPTEGGFLWGAAWRLTTGFAYRIRTGLDYKTLMRHEHINLANEIEQIISYFFTQMRTKRFPLPSFHLSFYTYIEAREPNVTRCCRYLQAKADAKFLLTQQSFRLTCGRSGP